jgi:hypothetical protein
MWEEAMISGSVEALIGQIIEQTELGEKIRKWLKRQPAQMAFKKAFTRAYNAFVRQYPEVVANLFDASFFTHEAVTEIGKILIPCQTPDPIILAKLWQKSIYGDRESPLLDAKIVEASAQWLSWLEAELKSEEALQPIFDSRALQYLPKLEEKVDILIRDIQLGLDTAIEQSKQYDKIIQLIQNSIDRGTQDDKRVERTAKYYFAGEFNSLNDLYIPPTSIFQRTRINEFKGREWLDEKVDNFLRNNKSGVILLIGEAGVGKTAYLAKLVKKRGYIHAFGGQISSDRDVTRAIQSLGVQLVTRYQIQSYLNRDSLPQIAIYPSFLEQLIQMSIEKCCSGERIIIVCDALDEVAKPTNGNVFGLPSFLPDGVYLILSQRPVNVNLNIDAPLIRINMNASSADNIKDIRKYLHYVAKKQSVNSKLQARGYSEADFVERLTEKSEGSMMYLHYVIEEIESESGHSLDLDSLPNGLAGYYAGYWDSWRQGKRGDGKQEWIRFYGPLLGFLGAIQEPVMLHELAEWSEFDEFAVERILSEDWRAFIYCQKGETGEDIVYPYHTSFRDFIVGNFELKNLSINHENLVWDLKKRTIKAHQKIITYFRQKCGGDWVNLIGEQYPYRNLASHLALSGNAQELTELLTNSDHWAKAKYSRDGHYGSYRNDLVALWENLSGLEDITGIIRTVFCMSSVTSSGGYIDGNLIIQCVKSDVISAELGFNFARQKPNNYERITSFIALYDELPPNLKNEYKSTILPEALRNARSIIPETRRANILKKLVKYLPQNLIVEAFVIAHEIQDEDARARVLGELGLHMPADQQKQVMAEALAAAHEIQDDYLRASVLAELGAHLPADQQKQVIAEALAAAREIQEPYLQGIVLWELGTYLPADLMADMLAATRKISDEDLRARLLGKLGEHLPADQQEQVMAEALAAAHEISDESTRARVLGKLGEHLPADQQEQVMAEALAAAHEISDESARARVLGKLGAHLPADLMAEALAAAREIQSESTRASVLGKLGVYLPADQQEQVMTEALAAARKISDEYERARVLGKLGVYLPADLMVDVLAAAREIQSESNRARVLGKLGEHLPADQQEQVMAEALAAARKISDDYSRARVLGELGAHLPADQQEQVMTEALTATRKISDEYVRASVLGKLEAYLPANLMAAALAVAREIQSEYMRASALGELGAHLPADLMAEALAAAREIQPEDAHASVLGKLGAYLSADQQEQAMAEALAAAREIPDEYVRDCMLGELGAHLPANLMTDALAAAREIHDEDARASVLGKMGAQLLAEQQEQVMTEALATARKIQSKYRQARVLWELGAHLPADQQEQVMTDALAAAREIKSEDGRARMLGELGTYLPADQQEQVMTEALAVAREIQSEYMRASVLGELVAHLPADQQEQVMAEALVAAREIIDNYTRMATYSSLALNLSTNLYKMFISHICEETLDLPDAFEEFARRWDDMGWNNSEEEFQYLNTILWKYANSSRPELLHRIDELSPVIYKLYGVNGITEIIKGIQDTAEWWP